MTTVYKYCCFRGHQGSALTSNPNSEQKLIVTSTLVGGEIVGRVAVQIVANDQLRYRARH